MVNDGHLPSRPLFDIFLQGGGATTRRGMVPVRDKLWHRLFKRGGEYFMSSSYAPSPRPLLLVVDNVKDAEVLRPLFLELQSSCTPSACGSYSNPTAAATATIGQTAALVSVDPRPPRVVLTGRGDLSCSKAAVAIGNAGENEGSSAILCDSGSFSSAWDLVAGKHYPRDGTGRAGGSGGRDHALMMDLTAGLAGAVETLSPLAVVSVAGAGNAAGPGGEGGGGAAIDEALSLVTARNGVPFVRLPRETEAGGAARWLSRLSPEAFGSWDRIRIDLLVVYDPASKDGSGAVVGKGGHTEAQLRSLLDSLVNVNFLGDKLDLVIASTSSSVPEAVREVPWARGRKIVRRDIFNLMSAVMRSWVPRDGDNFVVVLEADRVVSEFLYSWLKFAVLEINYSDGQQKHWGMASGVCIPHSTSQSGGGACLFPPDYWKWEQAACLGVDIAEASKWGGHWARTPPKHYLYQSLEEEFDNVLVARTDAYGEFIDTGGAGLTKDHEAFSDFVGRISFR